MPTESAQQALSILRDASQFQWYVILLFAMVVLFYFLEIEKENWNAVFAGLTLMPSTFSVSSFSRGFSNGSSRLLNR